jgi:polysaccharide export outer membrane protein
MDVRSALLMVLMIAAISGCASNGGESPARSDENSAMEINEYRIGVDDQLAVNVWRDPELSVTMPVRPDGMITVPLIGDVKAGGRTPQEVASTIKHKLSSYIRNPDVTVILTELRSHEFLSRIRVTGAVTTPMSLPYRQGMTALDAVLAAGGTNPYAAPDRTKVFRRKNKEGATQIIGVHLGKILTQGELSSNVYLQPGDVITVPERLF